jgi:O-acetyl-ADP-ribose deacetylase (regulator of RNase III)
MQCKTLIHCVASDQSHMTSAHIIQTCVRNALACAERKGCRSIAMPLFGTGHARYKFEPALLAMREALRSASARVEQVVIVIPDPARAAEAEKIIASRE